MLKIGQLFPAFSLQNEADETISNSDLAGKRAVIYFYPKDDTSGCTIEANEFTSLQKSFGEIKIFGVSPDSVKSHQKFIKKFDLKISLLSDGDHKLAEACGVWVEKSMYGNTYMGVERTTYLLDENGVILEVWRKVKAEGHAAEVLASCRRI